MNRSVRMHWICPAWRALLLGSVCFTSLAGTFAGSLPRQTRPALEVFLKKLGYVSIPLERGRANHLSVRAHFGGKSRLLIVDTGCTMTLLDKAAAKSLKRPNELGLQVQDPNLGVLNDTSIVLADDLELGSVRFTNQPAKVLAISPTWGSFADGLLGCDFFMRHFCLIDCADLRLYARADELQPAAREALEQSLRQSGYHEAQLQATAGLVLTCDARVNEQAMSLLIDTGSTFSVLNSESAIKAHLVVAETDSRIRGIGKIGDAQVLGGRPASFQVGGAEMPLHGLYLGMADMSGWKIGEKGTGLESVDGTLGADLLAADEALIDFRGRKLWFESAKPAAKPVEAKP